MFLTATNLVHYLVDRDLFDIASVIEGDFTVIEAGRRNRNFKVVKKSGTGLFLKQATSINSAKNTTVQREVYCYQLAQQYAEWAALMPKLIDHDDKRQCLTLGLLPNGENLTEYHLRLAELPPEIGRLVGTALGCFHRVTRGETFDTEDATFPPKRMPWILSFQNDRIRNNAGAAQLRDYIRENTFLRENMERLGKQWRFDDVIHGDLKWDNCVIYSSSVQEQMLKIIDWELIDYGDPSWDVAGIFNSYLMYWVWSMPHVRGAEPGKLIEATKPKLLTVTPALQMFWRSYLAASGLPDVEVKGFLLRAIEYSAVRILQTAFEALDSASESEMTSQTSVMLKISEMILQRPDLAEFEFFGIDAKGAQCNHH